MNSKVIPISPPEQPDEKPRYVSINPDDFVGLPSIDASNKDLPVATQEALEALYESNSPERIFCRGNVLLRIELDQNGTPSIAKITLDSLRGELARAANYYTIGRDGWKPALPPVAVVRDILSLPSHDFPVLDRITRMPVFAPDGRLRLEPGYDMASQTYYAPEPGLVIPPVPEAPTEDDLSAALRLILEELLCDFPFTGDADRANALALMIQPAARELISGPTPLFAIDKPGPGTGASLFAHVIGYVITGEGPGNLTAPEDEAEMRRTIFATLLPGPEIIVIDNVRHALESASLSSALTSDYCTDRVVGTSERPRVQNRATWIVTGNNLRFSNEVSRRTIHIQMDARMEQPWKRPETDFKHPDLRGWVVENRASLVWAVLTLVQNWIAHGRPKGRTRLGSFEPWSETIGGILECAGIKDFLANSERLHQLSDTETALWTDFTARWWEAHHDSPVKASELVSCAEGFDLRDNDRAAATRLGTLLREKLGCIFDGLQITDATARKGHPRWKLTRIN
jgi:putative DNA primase/helicase